MNLNNISSPDLRRVILLVPLSFLLFLVPQLPAYAVLPPDSGEGNTEALTLPDEVMRAPGRPKGFLFLNYYNNESVSVFNGGLNVQHSSSPALPLNGGRTLELTRAYNSKIARREVYIYRWTQNGNPAEDSVGVYRGRSWAGCAWSVHLGRISKVSERTNPDDPSYHPTWHFVEPDGTDHRLYEAIGAGQYGTKDGTYIRAIQQGNGNFLVIYPDGRWLELDHLVDVQTVSIGPPIATQEIIKNPDRNGWYTIKAGRGLDYNRPDYTVTYYRSTGHGHREAIERITDNTGRTLEFDIYTGQDLDPNGNPVDDELHGMLKRIRVPNYSNGEATYTFDYVVYRNSTYPDPDGTLFGMSGSAKIALLKSVTLPEGYPIQYEYDPNEGDPAPLTKVKYPTGGYSKYDYNGYFYKRWDDESAECQGLHSMDWRQVCYKTERGVGVVSREISDGTRKFKWLYERSWVDDPIFSRFWQVFVVTDPYGNATQYQHYGEPAGAGDSPLYGRVKEVTIRQGGTNSGIVQRQVFDQQQKCSATPYAGSSLAGWAVDADVRQIKKETQYFDSVYPTDPNAAPAAILIEEQQFWDGLGRFYRTHTSGSAIKGVRETTTWWDPNTSTWMLQKFTAKDMVLDNPYRTRSRSYYTFDSNGRVSQVKRFRNINGLWLGPGSPPEYPETVCADCGMRGCAPCDPNDRYVPPSSACSDDLSVPTYSPDPTAETSQDVIVDYQYGDPANDNVTLHRASFVAGNTTSLWDDPLEVTYAYENGVRKSAHVTGVSYDEWKAVPLASGLLASIYNPSDVRTDYEYDLLGRLKETTPMTDAEDATTVCRAPGNVTQHYTKITQGGTSLCNFDPTLSGQLYEAEYYDGLGRTFREEKALAEGQLGVRETAFAPTGQSVFVSEWIPSTELSSLTRRQYFLGGDPNSSWWIDMPINPATNRPWGSLTFYGNAAGDPNTTEIDNPLNVAWDPLMRVHRVVAADGATTITSYSALSRTITVKGVKVQGPNSSIDDPNTVDVSTTYWGEPTGRLLMVDSPVGSADALYEYDVLGNLTKAVLVPQLPNQPWSAYDDPNSWSGQTRTFLYDGVGRPVETFSPEQGTVRNDWFNVRGQPVKVIDERARERGYWFEYSYDLRGRPTKATRVGWSGTPLGGKTLLFDDFSSGLNLDPNTGWTLDTGSTWHWYGSSPGLEDCWEALGGGATGFIRVGSFPAARCGYGGGPVGKDVIYSPVIGADPNKPIEGTTVLTFTYFRDVRNTAHDPNVERLDRVYVEVADVTDGPAASSTRIFYLDSETPSTDGDWLTTPEIDLSQFKDRLIVLAFVFERRDQNNQAFQVGWAVDNVTVKSKKADTLWTKQYDTPWCGPSSPVFSDTCAGGESSVEREKGQLASIVSYQGGVKVFDEMLVYKGRNGRLSAWEQRLFMHQSDMPLDAFASHYRYDSLGRMVGLRAPQRQGEPTREYVAAYDREMMESLGEGGTPGRYVGSVEYNGGGGISRLELGNGVAEVVEPDALYRPHRVYFEVPSTPPAPAIPFDTGVYEYDGAGNITAMGSDHFIYDSAMRLTGSRVGGNEAFMGYDAYGNMTSHGTPLEAPPSLNFSGRIYTEPGAESPDNRIHDVGFGYDENGNLIQEPADGPTLPAKRYVFDPLNRLRELWVETSDGFIPVGNYAYDAGGVRVSKQDFTKHGRWTYYLRDGAGQVLAEYVVEPDVAEIPYRSKEYLHGAGRTVGMNMFCGPPPFLEWDSPQHSGATYQFKAQTPMALEMVAGYELEIAAGGSNQVLPVAPGPDGHFQVPDQQFSTSYKNYIRLRAQAECGDTVWSNELTLIVGQGSAGTPTREFDTAEERFFHLDHLGSTRMETGPVGEISNLRDYYPFGQEMTGGGDENTHRFTGHERDVESGMDYMLARYYRSAAGRFLSVDPASSSADPLKPQSWNRYAYTLNNPLRYTDPTGKVTKIDETETKKAQVISKQTKQETPGQTYVQIEKPTLQASGEVDVTITIVSEISARPLKNEAAVREEEADHRGQYKDAIKQLGFDQQGNQPLHKQMEGALNSVRAQGSQEGWSKQDTLSAMKEALNAVGESALSRIQATAKPAIDEYHRTHP